MSRLRLSVCLDILSNLSAVAELTHSGTYVFDIKNKCEREQQSRKLKMSYLSQRGYSTFTKGLSTAFLWPISSYQLHLQ